MQPIGDFYNDDDSCARNDLLSYVLNLLHFESQMKYEWLQVNRH